MGRLRTLEDAWRIVRHADHPALGLCLDSFHVLSLGDDPTPGSQIPGDKVFHVQLADAPRLNMDVVEWSRHHRLFPGLGSFDLPGFVGHVLTTGYDGPLALEVFNDVYRQADPRHAAIDGMRSLLALQRRWARSGRRRSLSRSPPSTCRPPPTRRARVHRARGRRRLGPLVSRALAALGFAHAGQHRSKPVQLWQQGHARILLNFAPQRTVPPGTAAICALGVESADPAGSAQRADRLLAPVLPRPRQPDEADLTSVAAPDGTAVFFCAPTTTGLARRLRPDRRSADPAPLVTVIDHVSLTESIDDFDQSALFYRSVLGLVPGQSSELAAPFGLIRSRSASDPSGSVRITLSTTPLRRGDWAPGVPSPQHVAFATDDAIASAKAMRALGAPVLKIPGNYYDDLDARLSLPPELLASLREHSILYDRDEHGEFLHFFTEMLGSRVFFEVVQRVDGYAGFGDPSSVPLRMAAHRVNG